MDKPKILIVDDDDEVRSQVDVSPRLVPLRTAEAGQMFHRGRYGEGDALLLTEIAGQAGPDDEIDRFLNGPRAELIGNRGRTGPASKNRQ